jgi:hypothetical protein
MLMQMGHDGSFSDAQSKKLLKMENNVEAFF